MCLVPVVDIYIYDIYGVSLAAHPQTLYASFRLDLLSIELLTTSLTSAVLPNALATIGVNMYAAAGLISSPSLSPAVKLGHWCTPLTSCYC